MPSLRIRKFRFPTSQPKSASAFPTVTWRHRTVLKANAKRRAPKFLHRLSSPTATKNHRTTPIPRRGGMPIYRLWTISPPKRHRLRRFASGKKNCRRQTGRSFSIAARPRASLRAISPRFRAARSSANNRTSNKKSVKNSLRICSISATIPCGRAAWDRGCSTTRACRFMSRPSSKKAFCANFSSTIIRRENSASKQRPPRRPNSSSRPAPEASPR